MFDPAYSQLLDTNQKFHSEFQDEIFINKSNEEKLCSFVKELEQCYQTISLQDNTIITYENEIEKLKSEISNLRKQKFKDEIKMGVDTPMQNPTNIIDSISSLLNTIRVTLQNITAERNQYQNLLNKTNKWKWVLIQQLRDMRNENLRSQQLLDES
ncbi:hypothetical protein C1645_838370 [Glomus cerebriforme]|uniref:Uncharacterized protein n=1 Tax=Glomus cerebriforme TaxID=658196 RepID=A0A397S3R0_9GLOM|nr:hypothetical protein C1645_838370 [Glomus cerebriforme]